MPDIQVNTLLDMAMLCLTAAVTGNPNPPANMCRRLDLQVAHDADLYDDLCCEGLGYVSFGDIAPSWGDDFPGPAVAQQLARDSCGIPSWAVEIRMGLVRCISSGTSTTMPSCATWTAESRQQADDAQALRAASCCLRNLIVADADMPGPFWGMSAVIGLQSQTQIQGGCVERNVTITVQMPNCDCLDLGD